MDFRDSPLGELHSFSFSSMLMTLQLRGQHFLYRSRSMPFQGPGGPMEYGQPGAFPGHGPMPGAPVTNPWAQYGYGGGYSPYGSPAVVSLALCVDWVVRLWCLCINLRCVSLSISL